MVREADVYDGDGVILRVAVVGQHVQGVVLAVFAEQIGVIHGGWRFGDRGNIEGDHGRVIAAVVIGQHIQEGLAAVEVGGRRIGNHAAAVDDRAALVWRADCHNGQGVAIGIAVIR